MMRALLLIAFCMFSGDILSQPYAREDTIVCMFTGVRLGISNPNPDHCYRWFAPVIEEERNNPNPLVFVKESQTYECLVTDTDWSFTAFEEVHITFATGKIAIFGEPIIPDPESTTIQGYTYLKDSEIEEVVWSISEDPHGTGCEIESDDPLSGLIVSCQDVGKIIVRAADASDLSCYTEKEVIIGNGIIDLLARDVNNGSRDATKDDTLYVVGPSLIQFTALTTSHGVFPGHPEWGGAVQPSEPHPLEWETMLNATGTYLVTCSGLKVTVIVLSDEEEEFEIPTDLSLWIQYEYAINDLAPFIPDVCGFAPHIIINVNNHLIGTARNKERNSDPGFYKYIKVIRDTNNGGYLVKSEGCGLLGGAYSKNYTIPGIGSFSLDTYITADDPPFTRIDNQILLETDEASEELFTAALIFDQGIEVTVLPTISGNPVDVFVSTGNFTGITSRLSGELSLNGDKIDYRIKWGGLQMNPKGYLYTGTPSNPMWKAPINLSYNIMDGKQTGWKTFANLSSLTD